MFPGWIGDSHMVSGAHLFVLSTDEQTVLEPVAVVAAVEVVAKMAPNFLSVTWHGEAFHRLGVHDVKSLILVDALFPLDRGKRREGKIKEKKSPRGSRVSLGLNLLCWLCSGLQPLGAIKGYFEGQSLNVFLHLM
jgi:hypothetical protein